jgi:hypothetical protein
MEKRSQGVMANPGREHDIDDYHNIVAETLGATTNGLNLEQTAGTSGKVTDTDNFIFRTSIKSSRGDYGKVTQSKHPRYQLRGCRY